MFDCDVFFIFLCVYFNFHIVRNLIFTYKVYKVRKTITVLIMSDITSGLSTGTAPVPSPAVLDTMVRVIMSQTEMTEHDVKIALERTSYDLKRVIREYMMGDSTISTTNTNVSNNNNTTSTNQLRFSEIRNFMDKSAEQYYRRQEMAKIYNQVLERKKAETASTAEKTFTEAQPNTHLEPASKL